MIQTRIRMIAGGVLLALSLPLAAQQQQSLSVPDAGTPVFRVDVVSRSIKVVNFHHRQGSSELALDRTPLAPEKAKGWVKVDSRTGATKVEAAVDKLNPPQSLGPEYLTYVLWAITPEGRPENLGELSVEDGNAKLQAATELQSFGLLVTAEPYFAVTQPSDAVVLEAAVKDGTTGTISQLEAKYELWPRGMYAKQLPAAHRTWSLKSGKEAPLALQQAQHALAIAKAMGADRYAADTIRKAEVDLGNAESYFNNKGDLKRIQTLGRNVTQLAEDARLIAVKKAEEERLETERQAAAKRLADAKTEAEQQARRRELAESERVLALEREANARLLAEQERRQRERLQEEKSAAEAATQTAIAQQQRLAEQKAQIEAEAARAKQAAAEAEQQRIAADQARQAALAEQAALRDQKAALAEQAARARSDAEKADQARAEAEQRSSALRQQLRDQLNAVLITRETARGLIVNMSDVLFDTGRHTLRAGAREKLARVAGIVSSHPGLTLEVEGHTDSVGSEQFNQSLSERRAESVREFLVSNGVKAEAITAKGFGEAQPVADNRVAAGRQQNRRVEIVVSGESIGARESAAVSDR